jgi:hypothetical protein
MNIQVRRTGISGKLKGVQCRNRLDQSGANCGGIGRHRIHRPSPYLQADHRRATTGLPPHRPLREMLSAPQLLQLLCAFAARLGTYNITLAGAGSTLCKKCTSSVTTNCSCTSTKAVSNDTFREYLKANRRTQCLCRMSVRSSHSAVATDNTSLSLGRGTKGAPQ